MAKKLHHGPDDPEKNPYGFDSDELGLSFSNLQLEVFDSEDFRYYFQWWRIPLDRNDRSKVPVQVIYNDDEVQDIVLPDCDQAGS